MTRSEEPQPPDVDGERGVREALLASGVTPEALEQAKADGTLAFLAIEHLALPDPVVYDLEDLARVTHLPARQIAQLWRSLGLPEPRPGDRIFTETDAEVLQTVSALLQQGVLQPDLAVQMSRVIGSSLARVAWAQLEAIDPDDADRGDGQGGGGGSRNDVALYGAYLMPTMPRVMDYVWRRHLQAAARRRMLRETGAEPDRMVVGFADLVGFTALSQQVTSHQLAAVVDRFEAIAYDTVAVLGGRVVKMIGDEVMFSVDDEKAAAEIALRLAEAYADDAELSDVRVGLAAGPVLQREADLFGPVVNLASRIVGIAFPASVVASAAVHDALADDGAYFWRSIGRRHLKDIGRVPLWVLRREADADTARTAKERVRARHAERQERLVERMAGERDDVDG